MKLKIGIKIRRISKQTNLIKGKTFIRMKNSMSKIEKEFLWKPGYKVLWSNLDT